MGIKLVFSFDAEVSGNLFLLNSSNGGTMHQLFTLNLMLQNFATKNLTRNVENGKVFNTLGTIYRKVLDRSKICKVI
jgi:hypothetical protein